MVKNNNNEVMLVLNLGNIIPLLDRYINGYTFNVNSNRALKKDILLTVLKDVILNTNLIIVKADIKNQYIKNNKTYSSLYKQMEYLYGSIIFNFINDDNIYIDIILLHNSIHLYIFKE